MGRIKDLFIKAFLNKRDFEPEPYTSFPEANDILKEPEFISKPLPMTTEECLLFNQHSNSQNKEIISKLDYKSSLLLNLIGDVTYEDTNIGPAIDIFAKEPLAMEAWLNHVTYKTNIKNFNDLLRGYDSTLISGDFLLSADISRSRRLSKGKIKCLKDLPLQKKILN